MQGMRVEPEQLPGEAAPAPAPGARPSPLTPGARPLSSRSCGVASALAPQHPADKYPAGERSGWEAGDGAGGIRLRGFRRVRPGEAPLGVGDRGAPVPPGGFRRSRRFRTEVAAAKVRVRGAGRGREGRGARTQGMGGHTCGSDCTGGPGALPGGDVFEKSGVEIYHKYKCQVFF